MNKKMYFYFHAGSKNHGCEAIVRSTHSFFVNEKVLISAEPEEDRLYEIDKILQVQAKGERTYTFLEKALTVLYRKLFKNERYGYRLRAKQETEHLEPKTIALSVGGDNYCYGEAYNFYLEGLNTCFHKKRIKTVLWGCSIEPETVTPAMEKDFAKYDLIAARESISYNSLKKYNPNTILMCDPAFWLNVDELPLPKGFVVGKTIGINVSPLIQKSETVPGITIQNYMLLIEHIINQTDYQVALVPHVVCEGNDDREPLQTLYKAFSNTGRLVLLDDCNCEQLKGYISRCCMFIGARTHATIAAYSTCVPTLVIGYSTKAKGIAKDLFGTDEHYVLPVQQLKKSDDITKAFVWLDENKDLIREHLESVISEYKSTIKLGIEAVNTL